MPLSPEQNRTVEKLIDECKALLRSEHDFCETSPRFERHPLVPEPLSGVSRLFALYFEEAKPAIRLVDQFVVWQKFCALRVERFKANLEALSRVFAETGSLQRDFFSNMFDADAISRADPARDIRSLISYAVGCMFGRYSVDMPGLIYAGGEWNASQYVTFHPGSDGLLPVCDRAYFPNDIMALFEKWLDEVFGTVTLEENLAFIADALGGEGMPREVIRDYFKNGFYRDHLCVYGEHPVYLLFCSGRKNTLNCLAYVCRWRSETIACVREHYVQGMRRFIRADIEDLSQGAKGVLQDARLSALKAQDRELRRYEEQLLRYANCMTGIDVGTDVAALHARFEDVLAPIK